MRRFEFVEGTSSKFWEVERKGSTLVITFGRIGTAGQTQEKAHGSDAAAESALDKLVREKTGKGYSEVGATAAPVAAKADAKKPDGKPAPAKEAKSVAAPLPTKGGKLEGFVAADKVYSLGIVDGKLVAAKDGKALASVPKPLKEGDLAEQLLAAIEMLDAHARSCLETVESWMLRSLATPRHVLEAVWRDEAWRTALEHAVVVPVDSKGKVDADKVGLLRAVDPKKGLGIVDLDGETKWIDAPRIMVPHPVMIESLDELRGLASELGAKQGIAQLFREVFVKPKNLEKGKAAITDYENGKFEMLQQAFGVAKKNGYRVSGGAAIVRVWERGRVVEARYFLGDEDPMSETETGDLTWVDDKQKSLTLEEVPAIAFSEGMRMAASIFAKRQVEEKENDDA